MRCVICEPWRGRVTVPYLSVSEAHWLEKTFVAETTRKHWNAVKWTTNDWIKRFMFWRISFCFAFATPNKIESACARPDNNVDYSVWIAGDIFLFLVHVHCTGHVWGMFAANGFPSQTLQPAKLIAWFPSSVPAITASVVQVGWIDFSVQKRHSLFCVLRSNRIKSSVEIGFALRFGALWSNTWCAVIVCVDYCFSLSSTFRLRASRRLHCFRCCRLERCRH